MLFWIKYPASRTHSDDESSQSNNNAVRTSVIWYGVSVVLFSRIVASNSEINEIIDINR